MTVDEMVQQVGEVGERNSRATYDYEVVMNVEFMCRFRAESADDATNMLLEGLDKAVGKNGHYDIRYEHAITP